MNADRQQDAQPVCGRIGNRPYWVLLVSVGIRAIHQVGAAVFLTAFLVPGSVAVPTTYLLVALVSGVALLITEGMRHRQIYREAAGVSTVVKMILIGVAYHGYLPAAPTVLIAFLLASAAAHLPQVFRHRLLF